MTADGFDQTVDAYLGSWSQFKQTADAISAVVQGYNESYAKWNISSDGIDATVLDGYTNSYARWNMTADRFEQTVDTYLGSWSQFKQTANAISAAVQGYNESYAKWNITANEISSKITSAQAQSLIDQTADSLRSEITSQIPTDYVTSETLEDYATKTYTANYAYSKSAIQQKLDSINFSVTKEHFVDMLKSYTSLGYNYEAKINSSYTNITINGYINAFIDLTISKYKNEYNENGELIIDSNSYPVTNADVTAIIPEGLIKNTNINSWYAVSGSHTNEVNIPHINNGKYGGNIYYTDTDNINLEKAKGSIKLDIQI